MREQFTTNAINLKSYSISEADKIIVMYSKEKGLIKGIAKGIKKTASKLGGRMDLLVANKMMLNKGRNLDTICQAEALNTFFNLRSDITKLFYAMYCCEIVSNFGTENDPNSEEIYNLFYTFLDCISKAKTKEQTMLAVIRFQLKIMNITGYSLELNDCVKCQKPPQDNNIYFSVENGGILCAKCADNICKKVKMPYKIKDFLNTLLNEDFNHHTYYDDLATEKICDICINLIKKYIEYYSPKRFKTTQILESIR
ncbi:MAG: DNA repair protein RecO [Candidatus Gastranaerophilales bacterium]|nr:DNA repair protein RecO [Candidatus Gastranaerophilales bacterium]